MLIPPSEAAEEKPILDTEEQNKLLQDQQIIEHLSCRQATPDG
jgi:hypothetical protein